MRYTCTIQNGKVVVEDRIDGGKYEIKGTEIDELGYLKAFSNDILREELRIIDVMLVTGEERRVLGDRVISIHNPFTHGLEPVNIDMLDETITSSKGKVVHTSPFIRNTRLSKEVVLGGIDKVVVNNMSVCILYLDLDSTEIHKEQSFQLVVKNKLGYLYLRFTYQNPIFIAEEDLSKISFITPNSYITLSIIELNKGKSLKLTNKIPHIEKLGVYTEERFSMLNLVNIRTHVNTLYLQVELYDIEEWFDKIRHIDAKLLRINENGQILDWFMQLEDSEYKDGIREIGYLSLIGKHTIPLYQSMHKVYNNTHITIDVTSGEEIKITYGC